MANPLERDGGEPLPQVKMLENLVMEMGAANIEASSLPIALEGWTSSADIGFCDVDAFGSDFASEAKDLASMQTLVEHGQGFISMIYTYRSCSKALPMVSSEIDDAERKSVHMRIFEVLSPEIAKIQRVTSVIFDSHLLVILILIIIIVIVIAVGRHHLCVLLSSSPSYCSCFYH